MRWLCILLPQLALDGVMRQRDNPDAPLALVTGTAQRRVLQTVNAAARKLGLRPGQSLAAAQAVTHAFIQVEYEPAEIERWQSLLAAWAYGFSSHVSQHYPRVLLMEIASSLHLLGPWPRLEARLRAELTDLGFRHRIVVAPNPVAARMLANAYDGLAVVDQQQLQAVLEPMPVDRLGLPAETAAALSRMGLRNLKQVLALPRDTLARRFPSTLLNHLDCLLGSRAIALDHYLPADEFDQRIELNFDVESHQALLFPLRRLTADLAAFLAGRDSGVQRFTLYLEHRGVPATALPVGLLSAERDPAMLFELARGRLEQLQIAAPTQAMRLQARDLPAFVPQHRTLFDERPQQNLPWEQLRERLRSRLGDEAVHGLQAQADHRPDKAWRNGDVLQAVQALSSPRPGWLLAQPAVLRDPYILAGPERIESGWWDGADMRRDYYLIETRSGQRGWAFRPVGEEGPLQLHGWFA